VRFVIDANFQLIAIIPTRRLSLSLDGQGGSRQMLNISAHHDTDLLRQEIVAVVSLVYGFWPNKDKTIPELVETFFQISRQYKASYPKIRIPSLRYVAWDNDKAVAPCSNFRASRYYSQGEISIMALSGACVMGEIRVVLE
jgi:hypothetical protein